MKVPLALSKFYGNLDLTTQDVNTIVEKIGAQLGAVEEVEDLGAKYRGAVIVKVVSCKPHPDSDHMNVCMIDDGDVVKDVERGADGLVQVVCGAPNVHDGMLAVWLPPGVTVPESIGKDPFVLGARNLRGVMSNGMLASMRELALGDDHSGIVDITPVDLLQNPDVKPGMLFADAFNLNDSVIDIENKMFTHRPDCFGLLGVYREVTAILGRKFEGPVWYGGQKYDLASEAEALPLKVTNELPELVPRFMAVPMSGITVGPSPLWLRIHLARVGIRSINNIVDITNFVMYLTGQPLHAYDYDKVQALTSGDAAELTVRYPKPGEKIALLNGKTIEPRPEAIMITSGDHLIGVGGVMGGADTEVSAETRNIILEVASFDMYSIRRTSMAHGLFTDAVTRFNKGQSPLQNQFVLAKAIHEVRVLAGGKLAGEIQDVSRVTGREWVHPPVSVTAAFINERLGFSLIAQEMAELLERVECRVAVDGDTLTVTAPFWRTDIETREDVVEEVGRLYGFDKLPLELPKRTIAPVAKNTTLELKGQIRTTLAKAGANEVLTYSFVHGDLLQKVGQDAKHAYQLSNALSPDLQYYRTGLTPSLLDKVHANIKAGYDSLAIFELGKVHYQGEMDSAEPEVPNEDDHLALVVAYGDKHQPAGAPYYQARAYLEQLVDLDRVTLTPLADFDLSSDEWGRQLTAPYEPTRAAVIVQGDQIWGVVGEFRAAVRRALKLPAATAGFEIHLAVVATAGLEYAPLPRFPKVTQDITLRVAADLPYQQLHAFVLDQLRQARPDQTQLTLQPLSVYQPEGDTAHKQVSFRVAIASFERTLTDAEVAKLLDRAAVAAKDQFGAERV